MTWLDWIAIGLYLATLLGVAWWVIRQRQDMTDDYFLAGRNLGWLIVGASIFSSSFSSSFSSNISSNIVAEHLVGLAGSGATDGARDGPINCMN